MAASDVPKELEVDKMERDTHQGNKIVASAVGELVRTVNKVKLIFICMAVVLKCFNLNHVFFNHHQEVINQFPEGCSSMTKSHHVAKRFSSTSTNSKHYNNMLKYHLFLPTKQLKQHHDGTRISHVHELLLSTLRLKIGMQEHCRQFNVEPFHQRMNGRLIGRSKAYQGKPLVLR